MEVKALHRNARMAPRKLRQYRQLLRGLSVQQADAQLQFRPGLAPALLLKVLRSAVANARQNFGITSDNLKVGDVMIDGGFAFKRFRAASKGTAHPIAKRTSHITVIVEELTPTTAVQPKRKTEIQDFTADDVISGKVGAEVPHTHDEEAKETPVSNEPHRSHQDEAYQKMKMMQQGGDPKKSHRRKSIGE